MRASIGGRHVLGFTAHGHPRVSQLVGEYGPGSGRRVRNPRGPPRRASSLINLQGADGCHDPQRRERRRPAGVHRRAREQGVVVADLHPGDAAQGQSTSGGAGQLLHRRGSQAAAVTTDPRSGGEHARIARPDDHHTRDLGSFTHKHGPRAQSFVRSEGVQHGGRGDQLHRRGWDGGIVGGRVEHLAGERRRRRMSRSAARTQCTTTQQGAQRRIDRVRGQGRPGVSRTGGTTRHRPPLAPPERRPARERPWGPAGRARQRTRAMEPQQRWAHHRSRPAPGRRPQARESEAAGASRREPTCRYPTGCSVSVSCAAACTAGSVNDQGRVSPCAHSSSWSS